MAVKFLKQRFHHARRTFTTERKADACFYLNSGNHHAAVSCKILQASGQSLVSRGFV